MKAGTLIALLNTNDLATSDFGLLARVIREEGLTFAEGDKTFFGNENNLEIFPGGLADDQRSEPDAAGYVAELAFAVGRELAQVQPVTRLKRVKSK